MRKLIFVIAIISIGLLTLTAMRSPDRGPKITICHIPPGNPDNAHVITFSINALPAHLAHGDSVGACETECTLETDPVCFCELYPDHPDCNQAQKADGTYYFTSIILRPGIPGP